MDCPPILRGVKSKDSSGSIVEADGGLANHSTIFLRLRSFQLDQFHDLAHQHQPSLHCNQLHHLKSKDTPFAAHSVTSDYIIYAVHLHNERFNIPLSSTPSVSVPSAPPRTALKASYKPFQNIKQHHYKPITTSQANTVQLRSPYSHASEPGPRTSEDRGRRAVCAISQSTKDVCHASGAL